MNIKQFLVNNKQSPYQLAAGDSQQLDFTVEFSDDNHPNTLTVQYDIDDSGKGFGITFSDGSVSITHSIATPNRLNGSVSDNFSVAGGVNGHFGIDLTIVQDTSQTDNISINYTNAHAAAMIMKSFAEQGMMKDVKKMINSAVKSEIETHVKKMHPKSKR